jgi:hypothetical protein
MAESKREEEEGEIYGKSFEIRVTREKGGLEILFFRQRIDKNTMQHTHTPEDPKQNAQKCTITCIDGTL